MYSFFYNNSLYDYHDAVISPFDRGFTLGDGLFETIKITNGQPELWQAHLQRLQKGCHTLKLNMPDNLYENCLMLIKNNQIQNAVLKVILTRKSTTRGLAIHNSHNVNIAMTLSDLSPAPKYLKAIISSIKRNDSSPLSQIKSINYGDNILAFNDAIAKGYDDALMLNNNNQPCCFTVGNIVIQTHQNELITPPSNVGCLEGTFLTTIDNLIYRNFYLSEAKQIFRSNCISGLVPVELE